MGRGRREKVYLTEKQREHLEKISRNGQASAQKIFHARILLKEERMTRKWTDEEIAAALKVHRYTVSRVRQRFLEKGEKPALERQPRKTPPVPSKIDGATEAQMMAWCCSDPPEGQAKWAIRLLTSELQQRQIIKKSVNS